jgi:hypothetical protein
MIMNMEYEILNGLADLADHTQAIASALYEDPDIERRMATSIARLANAVERIATVMEGWKP